jgi:hypothetical protein
MLVPATLTRVFLILLAGMVLIGFVLQWEQSQRLKFLGISVEEEALTFEIANYGAAYVGKTDYVGSIMFLTPREKSVSLFRGVIDLIPPSRSVTTGLSFDAPILPSSVGTTETSVTQLCLYTRGRLYFDTHFYKVYFRHSARTPANFSRDTSPDLELAEYKHVFFGRPACAFVGSGNYFTYEINAANIDCQSEGDENDMICHTDGVVKSALEGIFDPVQTTLEFDLPERAVTRPSVDLRNGTR